MDVSLLKKHYDSLLKDEDFDKLDLGLKNPNIFQILKKMVLYFQECLQIILCLKY